MELIQSIDKAFYFPIDFKKSKKFKPQTDRVKNFLITSPQMTKKRNNNLIKSKKKVVTNNTATTNGVNNNTTPIPVDDLSSCDVESLDEITPEVISTAYHLQTNGCSSKFGKKLKNEKKTSLVKQPSISNSRK